jgi:hypothetical protein
MEPETYLILYQGTLIHSKEFIVLVRKQFPEEFINSLKDAYSCLCNYGIEPPKYAIPAYNLSEILSEI